MSVPQTVWRIRSLSVGFVTFSPMSALLGYARVSTTDQDAALQIDASKKAGCYKVFVDQASGSLNERPELSRLLDQIRPGDTLVVWRLDRLGRSIRHLIDSLTELSSKQIGFRSLTENIDTTTSGRRLVFHIFAALAQMERRLLSERTRAGLAAAKARGHVGGRPTVMTVEKLEAARAMHANGATFTVISTGLGISRSTVRRALEKPT